MRNLRLLLMLILGVLSVGCTRNMALVKGQNEISMADDAIVLMSVRVANKSNPVYTPVLLAAKLTGPDGQTVNVNQPINSVENGYNDYLLSFKLAPGEYSITDISCMAMTSPFFVASCNMPLKAGIKAKKSTVTYAGHLNSFVRERNNDDEDRAGSLFPLLPQSVSGFLNGTFVNNIQDHYDEDLTRFRNEYPGLRNVSIEKAILTLAR